MRSKTRTRHLLWAVSIGVGCSLVGSMPILAADAPQSGALEEVVVTAQKREENLQTVPLSVTALSGATISALHIQDLKDVTATVPNVQIQVNAGLQNAAAFVVRGIGIVGNPSPYVGTEVGTVVDGVVQTVNELGLVDRFDVERIEVLRGPQGTLFGANTTGGVVNIVTRQPTGVFDVYGQMGVGNYQSKDVAVAVNFPLIDGELAGKFAIGNRSREGFYTNLYNGEDLGHLNSTSERAYLKWTPSDALDVTLKLEGQQTRNGTDVLLNISYPGEIFYRPTTPFAFALYSDVPDQHNSDSYGVTLTGNYRSDWGTFTSISNYAKWSSRGYQDIDGIDLYGYAQIGNTTGWQLSEELRDVIHPTANTELLIGAIATRWHYDSDGEAWVAFVSPDLIDETLAKQNTTNVSAFSQLYWSLTDRLRLQAGVRGSWDDVAMQREDDIYIQPAGTKPFKGFGNLLGAILQPVNPINPPAAGQKNWTNFGGKAGADYKISDNVMGYGYYARGFKSGGFNGRISVASDIGPFDPEKVDSFEGGVKTDWLDHRLRVNVSAFLNKWKDMQVDEVFFAGPVQHSAIVNAAKATTQGLELEGQVVVFDGFRIDATMGYLAAHYDQFTVGTGPTCPPQPAPQPTPCSSVYDGRDLPYAPKFNGSVTANYGFSVGTGHADAVLQVTHNGKRWGNFTEASSERLDKIDLVNSNLSWSPASDKWTIAFWGRNLFNKKYLSLALNAPPLFTEGLLGNPREYGVDFKFNYK
jgi:iron complex outermembrane recepter protein